MKIQIGPLFYEVHEKIAALLDGEGVRYRDGAEIDGSYFTLVKTLKRSNTDFEAIFTEMYDTTFGEKLLRNAVDFDGMNPGLSSKR